MVIQAYAKINLGLDILGRRPDGYHEIRTVMQQIDLCDTLKLTRIREPGVHFKISNIEEVPTVVPADERNLAYRAAAKIIERCGISEGVQIELEKKIPAAAGMAGGSTDAAAVLVGMDELFELRLGRERLYQLGRELGADVPFCIHGGTALCEGIGEKMTPLPPLPECAFLLIKPDVKVSTKEAYESLDREVLDHPDMEAVLHSIRLQDLTGMAGNLKNVFQPPIIRSCPVVGELISRLNETDALCACMSGSGPTVFAVFEDPAGAKHAAEKFTVYHDFFIAVARPVKSSPAALQSVDDYRKMGRIL
ncbi:MAG: 4-(cytidine 5'-diphospho)-2-C-methyl-D-erythritol kinase [Blautia sp.]|nr:4-(cytidine 5'-diphospho)-2-C-methyl-D-erythritol kinase [Blautia sp.]